MAPPLGGQLGFQLGQTGADGGDSLGLGHVQKPKPFGQPRLDVGERGGGVRRGFGRYSLG